MPIRLPVGLLLLLAAALCFGCSHPDKAPTAAALPPPPPESFVELLPELDYGYAERYGWAALRQAVQTQIVLPFGTPVPADTSRVVVCFEVRNWGSIAEAQVVRGLSPAVDSAVLAAVHQLHFRTSGVPEGRGYTLVIPAPGAASPAQRREATTRWQRTAVRRPGEADTAFVRRVLPLSYPWYEPNALQSLAWRASPYGRQLVFAKSVIDPSTPYTSYGWRDTEVFVLDPYRPHTYAVQRFHLENIGDLPDQSAIPFVADVNADGRPDLVTLVTYSQSEDGGHMDYYRVEVLHTAGQDKAGRPRYRFDKTPYPYLEYRQDETPGPRPAEFTPATVRRALARHWRRTRPVAAPLRDSATTPATPKARGTSPQKDSTGQ
ncbi:hypothetical protein [Hymenobacter ruricola]|uniref:TonB C-terminal domain-containing protein n=1 Tax=Hymenobacter ruricola TaxID=2791023 RepID=A0ABS0IAT3_9BACT|nr:hypothetical protein [Hymenobacter ruricola]MBF9224081.1 hypothetical protein [Hymenobacter ruricola]